MSKPTKLPLICLLGIDPEKHEKCNVSECCTCGWEITEDLRRARCIEEQGLTLCADGLWRLKINITKKERNER